jgi:hypothetical protein
VLTRFPQCFGVVPSEDALTPSQWLWVQCHLLLDEGVEACPQCDALTASPFCAACGAALHPEVRRCEQCQSPGVGAFCGSCGAPQSSRTEEAVDAGTFDWDAWAKSLAPFLGGITAQERALLES